MPAVAVASKSSPPTIKLVAPASDVIVKVLIPAKERDGPSPLRRSRSTPIRRPIPSATMRFRIIESRPIDLLPDDQPDIRGIASALATLRQVLTERNLRANP